MRELPVTDSHVHFWDPARFRYIWLDETPEINKAFLPDDYSKATDRMNVQRIVFVQCDALNSQGLEEADWITELGAKEQRIKAIVAFAPLEQGKACRELLETYSKKPLVKGIRRLLETEKDLEFCLRPEFIDGVRQLSEYDLTFDICVTRQQLPAAIRLVETCPDVPFILDHIASPDIKNGLMEPWAADIKRLSENENVVCKLSGVITLAKQPGWTREHLKPYIDHVLGSFGPDRIMYGGDWPVVTLAGEYEQWFSALEWALRDLSEKDMRKLLHENATEVYKLAD